MITEIAASTESLAYRLELDRVASLPELTESLAIFEEAAELLILHLLLDGKPSQLGFSLGDGEIASRAVKVSKSNELVAKAIGCKSHYRPKVLDATAGMGRDALIMVMLGCEVVMQERNKIIYHLLRNAYENFRSSALFSLSTISRLSLKHQNSIDSFGNIDDIDVIYLDPMFPERKKSALVKKEMRLFKRVAGEDLDSDQLMGEAIETGVARIVVKRPKGAPYLAQKRPNHEIKGKKFRYDVYLR